MTWKKTPKEEIESVGKSEKERSYFKVPGGMLVNATTKSKSTSGRSDRKIGEWLYRIRKQKPFMSVHTHPHYQGEGFSALPSKEDLFSLIGSQEIKTEVITQQEANTGEVQGYTFLHKKNIGLEKKKIKERKKLLKKFRNPRDYEDIEEYKKRLERVAKDVGVDIKYHPSRGYYFNVESGSYERKEPGLESKTMIILASFGILASLFFFSFNLTGNVVSNLNPKDGNILGIIFFLAGLVGFFISHLIKK